MLGKLRNETIRRIPFTLKGKLIYLDPGCEIENVDLKDLGRLRYGLVFRKQKEFIKETTEVEDNEAEELKEVSNNEIQEETKWSKFSKRTRERKKHFYPPVTEERELTIIIPCRENENQEIVLKSLGNQTYKNFKIVVSYDDGKGANYARNKGFEYCDTEYVLFADNDVEFKDYAIERMIERLKVCDDPNVSYIYGIYEKENEIYCNKRFDADMLKKKNYISTMSIIKSKDFPGFDESIKRLQDWDLWLNLLINHGKIGLYYGSVIFTTKKRAVGGITDGGSISWKEADRIIRKKYGLDIINRRWE